MILRICRVPHRTLSPLHNHPDGCRGFGDCRYPSRYRRNKLHRLIEVVPQDELLTGRQVPDPNWNHPTRSSPADNGGDDSHALSRLVSGGCRLHAVNMELPVAKVRIRTKRRVAASNPRWTLLFDNGCSREAPAGSRPGALRRYSWDCCCNGGHVRAPGRSHSSLQCALSLAPALGWICPLLVRGLAAYEWRRIEGRDDAADLAFPLSIHCKYPQPSSLPPDGPFRGDGLDPRDVWSDWCADHDRP